MNFNTNKEKVINKDNNNQKETLVKKWGQRKLQKEKVPKGNPSYQWKHLIIWK